MSLVSDAVENLGARPLGQARTEKSLVPTRLDNTGTIRPNNTGYSRYKLIKSGNMYESYEFEIPIRYGSHGKKRCSTKRGKSNRFDEYRAKSIVRAGFTLKRLAFLNFSERDKFLTLTFNNDQEVDINSLAGCLPLYQNFMKKLRRRYKDIKFLTVPEFQKRGAVHYHILCNLPYIEKSELQSMWPHGYSKPLAVKNTTHLAFYLSKYLRKRFDDPRKLGHRLYYSSWGLKRPKTVYGPIAEAYTEKLKADHSDAIQYENSYDTERNGVITFKQYVTSP